MEIRFKRHIVEISDELIKGLDAYLKEHEPFVTGNAVAKFSFIGFSGAAKRSKVKATCESRKMVCDALEVCDEKIDVPSGLEHLLENVDDTFQESLLKIIDSKGMKDSDVYKRADIDRRLFSKIRSNKDYRPKKQTALSLALALGLNLDETIDLIKKAGYALSMSSKADLIVRYCIEHEIFDLLEVNALLYNYDQPLLGGQLA